MNDENFGEMDSADSLDDSFSDSTTSCSEVDSDPENDFIGSTVSVTTQQHRVALIQKAYRYREEFVFEVVRLARGRCLRIDGGHGKRLASEALDGQQ